MATRTFTYKINMDLAGVKTGSKTMQVTLASMNGDAAKADASMQKLADTVGRKYGVQTKVARDETKSFQNAIKQAARESNRAQKSYDSVIKEFTHMKQAVGLTTDELQVLNAQMRLGASATEQQKQEVATLVTNYQKLRNEANKTQGSMRGLRGQASNVGFQLQDVAVQAQMGTNALVIMGQQGSQLLGGFGPAGALAGAGLAIVTASLYALAPAFIDSGKAAKELNDELVRLSKLKGLGKAQSEVLIAAQNELIKANEKESKQLRENIKNQDDLNETYDEYVKRQTKLKRVSDSVGAGYNKVILTQEQWSTSINKTEARLGVLTESTKAAKEEIKRVTDALNGGTDEQEKNRKSNEDMVKSLSDQVAIYGLSELQLLKREKRLKLLELTQKNATNEQKASATADIDALIALQEIADETKRYEVFLTKLTAAEKKAQTLAETRKKSNEAMLENLRRRAATEGLVGTELEEVNRQMTLSTLMSGEHTQAQIDATNAYFDIIIAVKEAAKETSDYEAFLKELTAAEKKHAKAIEDEADAYDNFLYKLNAARTAQDNKKLEDELKAEIKAYDDFLDQLEAAQDEREKIIATRSDSGRLAQLEKDYRKEVTLAQGNAEAIAGINEYYARERIKINGDVWEKLAVQSMEALEDTDQMMLQSMDRLVSGFGNAMAQMVTGSKKPGEALKDMFAGAVGSMVQFFAEWAAQKLILWALDKTLNAGTAASHATAMGANTGAKVAEAGLNAYTATAAIPIVGPALAPAAAGMAIAATSPMAATATTLASLGIGAFDKGGLIPAGGAGIVSEIGDELVGGTMVYNGSQNSLGVTGREDTARMRGGNGPVSITVNSSGSATPEAISRALVRALKRKSKTLDTGLYDAMNRGRTNRGKRFNA